MYTGLIELVCTAKEFYEDLEENPYTIELILHEFTDNIEKVSANKHKEYMKYFETIRDLLIENLMEKKTDLKKRLELISKYSNNSITTTSNNPNQKGRNDQKYCNNLYLDTGKTCKEIGALNKQKQKVQNSSILREYNREYKRMHGLHYNHPKKFTEKKFKEWSKKARELRDIYTDNQNDDFKIALYNLSKLYSNVIYK